MIFEFRIRLASGLKINDTIHDNPELMQNPYIHFRDQYPKITISNVSKIIFLDMNLTLLNSLSFNFVQIDSLHSDSEVLQLVLRAPVKDR